MNPDISLFFSDLMKDGSYFGFPYPIRNYIELLPYNNYKFFDKVIQ